MVAVGRDLEPDVKDVVEILVGDWRRKGRLESNDIMRLAEKRRLAPEALHEIVVELSERGIRIDDEFDDSEAVRSSDSGPANGSAKRLLTREEERTLANAIRVGARLAAAGADDPLSRELLDSASSARDEFVTRNLRLVHWVARRSAKSGLDYEDLVQEGTKGLMRAVELFDPDLGYKFSTYAHWWVRQAIFRGIDDTGSTIRIPVHAKEAIRRLVRMQRRLHAELGFEPNVDRLAAALDWTIEKTAFMSDLARFRTEALDAPLGPDGTHTLADKLTDAEALSPEDLIVRADLAKKLDSMIETLPTQRMKDIIRRRMGIGCMEETLEAIGQDYGVTRERIRQIEARALRFLSHPSRSKALKPFWE